MTFENSLQFARQLDEQDPLRRFRKEFITPEEEGKEAIYFLGNSLGLQPRRANYYLQKVLKAWSQFGVEGFFKGANPWLNYHNQLTPYLSSIVGALPHEVVVMNQLTVNLHLMLASFYQPAGKRNKIICEAKAFPSDQYMLHSHVAQRGLQPDDIIIEVNPLPGEAVIRMEDIIAAIHTHRDELALVFWGGVNYYTGQVFDMESITKAAHEFGARAGFDLAHAAGNISLQLHNWDVDFACWCSYKYLNAGPGAVGGAYIHERYHQDATLPRLSGWWGHKKETQFLMNKHFEPEASAEGWQLSTPSPIQFALHQASLAIFEDAGFKNVLKKNSLLTAYLWFVIEETVKKSPANSIRFLTPTEPDERGCQLSMVIKNGKQVFDALTAARVFADWREPDVIRIAPVALYNTYEEVWQFAQLLTQALNTFAA